MVQSRDLTILGIDPGSTRVGYAVVSGRQEPRLILSGVAGDPKLDKLERLLLIHRELASIIKKTAPDAIAIEKLFFSKNVKTAFEVAESRGAILLTAKMVDLKVYEYTPQEVKIALTSYGGSSKKDVARMVATILPASYTTKWDDETDAAAIALTALATLRILH